MIAAGPPAITVVTSSLTSLRENVLPAVAGTVNTTVADLQGRLRAGQSLADIARSAGIPRPELITAIQAALAASGVPVKDLPQDKVLQRVADHRRKAPRSPDARSRERSGDDRGDGQDLGSRVDLRL
jgi:hypothetical protein